MGPDICLNVLSVMVVHSDRDFRMGVSQAEQFFGRHPGIDILVPGKKDCFN